VLVEKKCRILKNSIEVIESVLFDIFKKIRGDIMKTDQLNSLTETGVVAVVRKIERVHVMNVISALVEGGITGIEVTVDSEDAYTTISEAKKKFGSYAVIGAGTVLDGVTANMAIQAGADFIFSPTLSKETITVAKRYGKIVIPGVFTPTEILTAMEWGADIVKVFPASVLGPEFIKDVKGPLSHIPMMPTGGVNLENTADYINAGSAAVGIGGSLLKKEFILNHDMKGLADLANQYVTIVKNSRSRMEVLNQK
jgi:2-dehydro-3-deoxyphosphogluconate aldolase / (4S)-4-hydroxy-2-oxoglutarate aldolase